MSNAANDDYRAFFDRNFVSAFELEGRERVVTIEKVERGELPKAGSSKVDRKPILKFVGVEKKLVLNKTNAKTVAGIYGKNVRNWVGKALTLYPTETKLGKETVDCIRIRPVAPEVKGGAS